ncbi:cilia- and flagella-associated protein 46-like [Anneissia japonica]|uniref:cilia- and flagella-associated protein 46-like n=1 Tax=Anneissia japonica TaxID=1529436 RepID=UPI001425A61D|nr:cilia- and flagella-associated protein 46-like [Anneissia japonica]
MHYGIDKVKDGKTKSQNPEEGRNASSSKGDHSSVAMGTSSTMTQVLGDPDDDLTLRAAMYGVLFQALADKGNWEEGLAAMDKAINDMPRTRHRLLIFKHRVMTKAKLGRQVEMDLAKFKDESEDYVALMWHKVALCSKDQLEQLTSHQNAIEALKSSTNDWQKVEYLLKFGEWLYVNEFGIQDCVDQVQWAADILLNMKIVTRSKLEQAKSKKKRKGKKSGTTISSAAPTDTKRSEEDVKAAGGEKSEPKGNHGSDSEEEINAADFIPVKRQTVVGLSTTNLLLNVVELTSVKQLEYLFRVHVMLALMSGRASPHHKEYCLLAVGFLNRIWQVAVTSAGQVAKEVTKVASAEQIISKTSAKGKKGKEKGKDQETPKEKPKRKGPIDALPSTIQDWAVYEVPDEIREAFKDDNTGEGVNSGTILKPTLTMYYIDRLVAELSDLSYGHLTFQALILGEVIAEDIAQSPIKGTNYRLRIADICLELNLPSAATFHEESAGPIGINALDQAKSRESIARWKDKQIQVKKEQLRVSESKRVLTGDNNNSPKKSVSKAFIAADQKADIKLPIQGLGKHLSSATLREMWTEQATILLKQGYYQAARHLLDEAYLASSAFSDDATSTQILQTLAQLAYQEANYGQTLNLLKEAQKLNGDEMFWLETSLLMVDAILGENEDPKKNNKARALLLKALAVYEDLILQRPNKASLLASIKGKLLAKFASLQVGHVLSESRNTMDPKAHRELQTACQKFEQSVMLLTETGYLNEAVEVLQQHANVLRLFVCDSTDLDIQHSYLLQAYNLLEKAVRLTNERMEDALGMSPTQQMRGVVLPIQRQACAIKNALVELLIDIFVIHADEARKHKTTEARKPSVIKLVETYIAESPTLTDTEMKWQTLTEQLATKALMELTAAHSLAGPIQELRAKTLYNLGRCLRIMAVHNAPDSPNLWDVQLMGFGNNETTPSVKEDGEAEVEALENEVESTTSKESIKLAKLAKHAQAEQSTSLSYLAQASEALGQCVQLALKEQLIDLVAGASLEMVECCGQYDPLTSSLYLALYQSCQCSIVMKDVLEHCQQDPSTSQQAALLHQRRKLLSDNLTSNQFRGNLMKSVDKKLMEVSEAWKRLKINPNHLELFKDLPANFNLLILQHSEDRSILYGSLLDKPKQSGAKEGKTKGGPAPLSKACVTRTLVDPEALDGLLQRFKQHKFNVMQALLKAEYRRSQQVQRNKMLENLAENVRHDLKDLSGENELEEQELQDEFSNLVRAMQDYLRPITTAMEPAFRALDNSSSGAQSVQDEYVVILADKWLMELPLEALPLLASPSIFSLSRDFSFQMLYNRMHQEPDSEEQPDEKKKKEAAKAKLAKEKNKSVKILPLERQVPPHCCGVDTHKFKYVIDPHNDCSQTDNEDEKPINIMTQTLNNYQVQFTARWEGIMGIDHVPSIGEWETYMSENSAFIFYGMERFFSHIHPSKVIPRNMSECKLAILLDLVQTSKSFLRQSKIDVIKTHNDLKHEKPVEVAMLMSMTGIGSLVVNQWHCALKDNAATFNTLMKALLETGRTSGQTIRRMFIPHWRPEGEVEDEEGEGEDREDGSSAKACGSEAKNGKNDKKPKGSAKNKSEKVGSKEIVDSKPEEEVNTEEIMSRHWFNVVCYGLPNVMVVQM